jgi:hypothetical protein
MRTTTTTTTLAISCLLGGCLIKIPGNLDAGEEASSADETDGGPGDGDPGDGDDDSGGGHPPSPAIDGDGCQDAVDILLILDNSGSMGEKQSRLAQALVDPLLAPLELGGVDWRFAITTTDVGNLWCPPAVTNPAYGHFQLRACNEHIDDFLFGASVDMRDVACNDICAYPPGTIHTLPSTTAGDPVAKPRPWIESIGGVSNLPAELDLGAVAACLVPQGINGCGFEQPLEAMALALTHAANPGKPEGGFLRDDASLLVIIVTDEVDCSHADESIFDPAGNRMFWSDPNDNFPTSALCWNAGVQCLGSPPDHDDCVSANFDTYGNPTTPAQAMLHPIDRYVDLLTQIEQGKRALDPGADVGVLIIGGLGTDGQLHYTDTDDPSFMYDFGIGPGCVAAGDDPNQPIWGLPPVRMREVGEALSSQPLASICAESYHDALFDTYQRLFNSCGG